jgi:DNA-binding MarR family transcriptional regulator
MGVQTRRPASGFFCGARSEAGEQDMLDVLENEMLRLVWLEQKRLAQTLAAHRLTVPQFLVLASIWERHSSCQMGELAGDMLQSSATMTGIVDRLVGMQLVYRLATPGDRRVVMIDLTAQGRDLMVQVRADKRERLQRILDHMAEHDRLALLRLIGEYLAASERIDV